MGFYEVAAASILYVVLPPVLDKRLGGLIGHVREVPAADGLRHSVVMRMEFAARAMQEVAGTVDGVSKKLAGAFGARSGRHLPECVRRGLPDLRDADVLLGAALRRYHEFL